MKSQKLMLIMCLLFSFLLILSVSCEREGTQGNERTDEGGPSQGAWTIDDQSTDDDGDDDDDLPDDYGTDISTGNMDPANPIVFDCNPGNLDGYELALMESAALIDIQSGNDGKLAACAGNLIHEALRCALADQCEGELIQCLESARDGAVKCGYEPADLFNSGTLASDMMKLKKSPGRMTCLKSAQTASDSFSDWDCLLETKAKIEDCLIR